MTNNRMPEVAALGGGCFWCLEAVFDGLTAHKAFADPIVTKVVPAQTFYLAEDYHQEYFAHNGRQPYCQVVVAPKVAKFREKFSDRVKR